MATPIQDANTKCRIPLQNRRFTSSAVEDTIQRIKQSSIDPELAVLFENCFPNTLDTTVVHSTVDGKPDTFVITGDIDAMWLRDSTAQVWPYLPLTSRDSELRTLIEGVIRRQTRCILIDPYANAFNPEATGKGWQSDKTAMKPELHERKWEIDSICYPVRLAYGYWKTTRDVSPFDKDWEDAIGRIVTTFREQQRKENDGPYRFQRKTHTPYDTLSDGGRGNPIKPVGLICSSFRPSDDASIYPFLIPSNMFAVTILKCAAEMVGSIRNNDKLVKECLELATEVQDAIMKYAIANHPTFGKIIAFECDGFGNHLLMDDANIPSLLSLPYLGCISKDDPLYRATRAFVLSDSNPYFFKGSFGEGIGGPHVGRNMIWPMSIIMRALTSESDEEIVTCLSTLKKTHAGTGFMHETFHKDNPAKYTRSWFAWANTLFGELILTIAQTKPSILSRL